MLPRKEEATGSGNAEWGPQSELMLDRGNLCQENGGTGITCVVSIWCPQLGFFPPAPYLNAWTWEIKNKSCNNFARKTVFWGYAQQGGKSWGHKGTMSLAECIHSMSWWGAWDNSYKDHLTREHLVPSITLSPSRSWSPFCSCLHLSEWIAAFPFLSIYFPHCFFFLKE